jgi:hypothetical protein
MWFFLLNVPHILRGFLGLQILKRVPKSHEFIETMKPRTDEEAQLQMTLNQYEYRMQTTIVKKIKSIYDRIQFKLRVYFILTLICTLLDISAFIV